MKFNITPVRQFTPSSIANTETQCLILFVKPDNQFGFNIDQHHSFISVQKAIDAGDLPNQCGSTLVLYHPEKLKAHRVLLVRLSSLIAAKQWREIVQNTLAQITKLRVTHVTWCMAGLHKTDFFVARDIAIYNGHQSYRTDFIKRKLRFEGLDTHVFHHFIIPQKTTNFQDGLMWGCAIAEGICHTKFLADLPANFCTPEFLAEEAKGLAKNLGFKHRIFKRSEIEKLGMASFLSVSQGSDVEPRFIVMEYEGTQYINSEIKSDVVEQPIVLVGKGITFDSGGISIKPAAGMDEMKYDMGGAAAVIGVMRTIALARLPINVVALIPACENLPSGRANKPGDVVLSMKGLSIEILNTDAEGRLVLCDALTYAERYKPKYVIDLATLTGACVTSLGHINSGLFSRHDDKHDLLANEIIEAGEEMLDPCWRMPLNEEYYKQINSTVADLANIGGPAAGSITAACFLSKFTENYTWAHLDIAGTAWTPGKEKAGTGRPVPLLSEFLRRQARETVDFAQAITTQKPVGAPTKIDGM